MRSTASLHLLLTKFNVPLVAGDGPRRGIQEHWLAARMELFERWTLPSVAMQTRPPDRWLIFVDAQTPERYLSRLRAIRQPLASICTIDGQLSDEMIGTIVREYVPPEVGLLLTSRIDNDDAIAATYLERVWGQATGWRGFLNPRSGLQYVDGMIFRRWDSRSPFLTMVEDLAASEIPRTAFSVEHHHAETLAPVRQIGGPPLWIQVVHGQNLANKVQGLPYPHKRASAALGWAVPARGRALGFGQIARAAFDGIAPEIEWVVRRARNRSRRAGWRSIR